MLRLPYGVKDLFQSWLEENFPEKKKKILHLIREMRGGQLNDSQFGDRMRGQGAYAEQIAQMFRVWKTRLGLNQTHEALSTKAFRRVTDGQMELFEL